MDVINIFSYLVYPLKNEETISVRGTKVNLEGRLFRMLSEIFHKSDEECDIPIRFTMSEEGEQKNEVRDSIIQFSKDPTFQKGELLATRLQNVTTKRSGLGLLFFIKGEYKDRKKLLISRFPADVGIMADPSVDGKIKVEYIENIFMKNATTYKAVMYKGNSYENHFWDGYAIDKQINAGNRQISNYWIREFLKSDFRTTSKAGSRRLANSIREALKNSENLDVKQELVAAVALARNLDGESISIEDFSDRTSLSKRAKNSLESTVGRRELYQDKFKFDYNTFNEIAAYKTIELDNGGIISASSDSFDDCFDRENIDENSDKVRFSTEGRIRDEKIRGRV